VLGLDTIDRIVELLEQKGITAAQMSRDLNFSNAVFSQWRQRKQKPSIEKLLEMADYFEVTLEYLLGREPVRYPFGIKSVQPGPQEGYVTIEYHMSDGKRFDHIMLEKEFEEITAILGGVFSGKAGSDMAEMNRTYKELSNYQGSTLSKKEWEIFEVYQHLSEPNRQKLIDVAKAFLIMQDGE